jgi:chromate reductase, NAD(P)H dehydrogenase (quinone)
MYVNSIVFVSIIITIMSSISSSSHAIKIAILTGSTRTSGPPHPILGPRVAKYLATTIQNRGHEITKIIDPRTLPHLEKPHFSYSKNQVPTLLQELYNSLMEADGYVMITPEMNHGPSPGLLNTMNHFGSTVFGYKPSLIVSYSPSQWGGVRAAHTLRPILSELGCLPVSAMIHFPHAHEIFQEDGTLVTDHNPNDTTTMNHAKSNWDRYTHRALAQLEWWTEATRQQRLKQDPYQISSAFRTSPQQRNTPSKTTT